MTTLHEFRGVRYTIPELAEMSGILAGTLRNRLRAGWTIEQAVTIPTRRQIDRGVVSNFGPSTGTGAGSVACEISEIDFSEKANAE